MFGREGKDKECVSKPEYFSRGTFSGEQECSEGRKEFADVVCKEEVGCP